MIDAKHFRRVPAALDASQLVIVGEVVACRERLGRRVVVAVQVGAESEDRVVERALLRLVEGRVVYAIVMKKA